MAEFVENVRMVLGILGYPILEPLLRTRAPDQQISSAESSISEPNPLNDLVFRVNNITAYGAVTDEGFVLKKGSQVSKTSTESAAKVIAARERHMAAGILIPNDDLLVTTEDILVSSSSYAAAIVAGTSRSGPQSWKASDGRTLKEIEDASLPLA
jgi:roadblock/LC7 domain-containing protein